MSTHTATNHTRSATSPHRSWWGLSHLTTTPTDHDKEAIRHDPKVTAKTQTTRIQRTRHTQAPQTPRERTPHSRSPTTHHPQVHRAKLGKSRRRAHGAKQKDRGCHQRR